MYNASERTIIWLDYFGLGHKKNQSLLSLYNEAEGLVLNFKKDKDKIVKIIGYDSYSLMEDSLDPKFTDRLCEKLEQLGIFAVTCASSGFPQKLKEIKPSPIILYTKGDIKLLNCASIAIVGTRKPTRYGRDMAAKFASELTKAGFVIISGLAFGIDTEVHEATLKTGGKTISVLARLDDIYPAQNINLAGRIKENGLLVSENRPGLKVMQYSFPERNRIISGLSKGVVIVEAGVKSGSLITANCAIEQNRDLFILPSNITSVQGKGSNQMIAELPHTYTINTGQILSEYGIKGNKEKDKAFQLSMFEQKIYDLIIEDEIHFDELQEKTGLEAKSLNTLLTTMEINGIIKKLPGNYYSL